MGDRFGYRPLNSYPSAYENEGLVTVTGTLMTASLDFSSGTVYLCGNGVGTALHATADLNGAFSISNVPAGTYTLNAGEVGVGSKTLTVVINKTDSLGTIIYNAAYVDPTCPS